MLLNEIIEQLTKDFQKILVQIMDKVNALTTAMDMSFKTDLSNSVYNLCCVMPLEVEPESVMYIKDALIVCRQYEITTR